MKCNNCRAQIKDADTITVDYKTVTFDVCSQECVEQYKVEIDCEQAAESAHIKRYGDNEN